jgi:FMN phosphatase YigB (HAD superfamily)
MLNRLPEDEGLEASDILHTAQSLFHDHVQAKAHGLANVWIDRQRLSEGGNWGATRTVEERPETDFLFFSMGEMADAVRAESA